MRWYGVHVLMTVIFKDGIQDKFPAWENIYLVQAQDAQEARVKASVIGMENEGDSAGTFEWDQRPATWVFQGVRKVIDVSNSSSISGEPGDGAEITYNSLEFATEEAVRLYASGEATELCAIE